MFLIPSFSSLDLLPLSLFVYLPHVAPSGNNHFQCTTEDRWERQANTRYNIIGEIHENYREGRSSIRIALWLLGVAAPVEVKGMQL